MPASRYEVNPHPPEEELAAAILFVGSSTEPSPGAVLSASEPESLGSEGVTGMVQARARLARPQPGWDAYEVWRTRVKGSSTVMQEREREPSREPLRERVRRALRARAGAIARAVQPG